jgi:hypothetical protein
VDVKELEEIVRRGLPGLGEVRLDALAEGKAQTRMTVTAQQVAPNGLVHAGVLILLTDTTCGLGCMHGLEEAAGLIPRPARQEFSLFMWAGWLDAKLVELPVEQAANAVTRRRFAGRWPESNPRFRAAHAVAGYLEGRGLRL